MSCCASTGLTISPKPTAAAFTPRRWARPSLPPAIYFRLLMIGYFEGIDWERGIAWRAADSLALRDSLGLDLHEMPPDHSTISRTRRLIDVETHGAVFTWILQYLRCGRSRQGQDRACHFGRHQKNSEIKDVPVVRAVCFSV